MARTAILDTTGKAVLVGPTNPMPVGSGKTLLSVAISLSATGTLVSAVALNRIKVFAVLLSVDAAISVYFRSGAATALEGSQAYEAKGGYAQAVTPPSFLFATAEGERLDLVLSGVGNARGRLSYWIDDTD